MKSNLTAEQAAAIERFRIENDAVLQLSAFPIITFRLKKSEAIVKKSLTDLVYEHQVAKLEESKTRADEKKRLEREEKWKPTIVRF